MILVCNACQNCKVNCMNKIEKVFISSLQTNFMYHLIHINTLLFDELLLVLAGELLGISEDLIEGLASKHFAAFEILIVLIWFSDFANQYINKLQDPVVVCNEIKMVLGHAKEQMIVVSLDINIGILEQTQKGVIASLKVVINRLVVWGH